MEEASAQQQSSAFPAPPFYFQRLSKLPFPVLALEPPPPVQSGKYWQFGRPFDTQETLATLEQQGCQQLYPKGPIDRVKELKKLNHSAIFNFLELVHTLTTTPGEHYKRVDEIRMIFINMHHILNEYRPHQARETLRLMMQNQLQTKKQETEALKRTCADLRSKLSALRALKEQRQRSLATINSSTVAPGDSDVEMTSSPDHQTQDSKASLVGASSSGYPGAENHIDANSRRTMDRLMTMVDSIE
ncbi:mediator of RNA polymerase II transcription subunit 7 [Entomortierella parvispora]|uniref:Mediator of RNA polymerase II transcription subunit 7 n=1 Tax=Entomortierella parvispora TaxID=205924 RepID=A0A9P3LUG5_9FUNG|nr:mediator of RNA polymerase II transcription subunit 7 [Entomortierella parvispora]